jgi:murein DD-endopeptidase MepM/ murein hydrolase activator NlpD
VGTALPCSTLHAGRARLAAVYVRLPVGYIEESQLAQVVSQGVKAYLGEAEARIRQNRGRTQVVWPAFGPITSHYGPDHALGIDIGQWEGDVVAAADGIVTYAGGDPCCSYGLHVLIESPGSLSTLYGHLAALYVQSGDTVTAGQPLGPVGTTGHSSGVHLHFEVIKDGVRVNPLSVLP